MQHLILAYKELRRSLRLIFACKEKSRYLGVKFKIKGKLVALVEVEGRDCKNAANG